MTVDQLLRAAALAGRQSPPPTDDLATYGHAPVPPTLRCQTCGRRVVMVTDDPSGAADRWEHDPADVPRSAWDRCPDPAFDAAFDETYRR